MDLSEVAVWRDMGSGQRRANWHVAEHKPNFFSAFGYPVRGILLSLNQN
jgi:hypothetical protein